MDTLRALETAIAGFCGSVMCISHDRWFLDRLATHILAFEGDSKVMSPPPLLPDSKVMSPPLPPHVRVTWLLRNLVEASVDLFRYP